MNVPVSRKAAALLAYLTLEGVAHHRDHLASLLWDNGSALLNLRVELTRLRQQGIDLFPARQAMLALRLPTDLDVWEAGSAHMQDDDLTGWLALLRDPPLGGLDDLGSGAFRSWLDHQRAQLSARLEQQGTLVAARLERQGHGAASAVLRARAADLGLELGTSVQGGPAPHRDPAHEDWQGPLGALRHLLGRARQEPQCVLIRGQPGSARAVVGAAAGPAGWHAIQLQYTPNQEYLLQALVRHLIAPLPAAERIVLEDALTTADTAQNLLRLATLLARQPQPILLALHDMYETPGWLSSMLGLLMDLRVPLLVVVAPTRSSPIHGETLANIDWTRVHQLTLPPLSSAGVYAQLRAAQPHMDAAPLRARAVRIAQLSEGWAPYVDALLAAPDLTPRLPAELGTRIRAQYGHVEAGLRRRLAVLAQVQGQFTLATALALLGEDGATTVQTGLALGIVVHAAPHDHVRYPTLDCGHNDTDCCLVFRSEVVRVALAGALPPAERQGVRRCLASVLLPTRPHMALYYAGRVQDTELTERAQAALPEARPVTWQRAAAQPVLVGHDPRPDEGRRVSGTPNGYRLCADGAGLEVLRRGPTAPPPRLTVSLGRVEAGPWTLTLRLDAFRSPARLQTATPDYAVGLQVGDGPMQAYAPEVTASGMSVAAPPAAYFVGLPVGQDVQLTGRWDGPPGLLHLSFQAVDLACTVHALRWNGRSLLSGIQGDAARGAGVPVIR